MGKYRTAVLAFLLSTAYLTAAPPNMVPNPGAEQGGKAPGGWTAHPFFGTEKVVAGTTAEWTDEAHSGKKALKITVTKSIGRTLDWSSDFIPVTGGVSLKVSGWMKTENVVPGPTDFSVPIFMLRSYDRQRNMNKQFWVGRAVPRETEWTKYEAVVTLPEDTAFVQLRAGLSNCAGTAWFDDFEVALHEKADATAGLLKKAASGNARAENQPAIVPLPWKEEYGSEMLEFRETAIVPAGTADDRRAVEDLKRFLGETTGREPSEFSDADRVPADCALFLVGTPDSSVANALSRMKISINWKDLGPQGYVLAVGRVSGRPAVVMAGNGIPGVYYAVQTFKQWPVKKDGRLMFVEGTVIDRPSYEKRAFIGGPASLSILERRIKPLKLNMFFAQIDTSASWDKPFSAEQKKFIGEFVRECEKGCVVPVAGMRPDRGYIRRIEYSSEKDINIVRDKYRDFYEGGFRDFYFYLDDGPRFLSYPEDIKKFGDIAGAHYYLIDTVYRHLKNLNPQNKLYVVLIHYGDPREWVPDQVEYIKRFSNLPADIELFNAGTMTAEAARKHMEITGRKPFVWDNWVSSFDNEKPTPSIVPPVGTEYSQDLVQYTTGYSFPIPDKDMMWYYAANYMWNASRYNPDKAMELIMAKMFGPDFPRVAAEFGKYRDFVVKNRDFPFKGRTAQEQEASARELVTSLRSCETNLKESLPEALAKEVEAGVRERTEVIEKALIPLLAGKPMPVIVPFTDSPPVVDGKTDEDCWKAAVRLTGFTRPVSQWKEFRPAYPDAQTGVMLLRSADGLHVAFSCDEPAMEKVAATVRLKDGPVYSDDCVEIFLAPGGDGTRYYHIAVNSLGAVYDACGQDASWDSGALAAVSREKDRWTVELTIPAAPLGGLKEPSGSWTFNVCRERYAAGPEFGSWAYILKRFHEPQRFWPVDFETSAAAAETEKKKIWSSGEMKQKRTSSLEWLMAKLANYDHTWMTFAAVEALPEEDREFLGPEMELLVRTFSGFPDGNCYFSGMWGGWSGLPEEGRYPDYRREWDISRLIGYDPVTGKGRRLYHAAPDVYTAVRTFFPKAVEAFRAGRRLEGDILLGFIAHYLEDEATFPVMQALHRGHHFDYSRINVSGYRPALLGKSPAGAAAGLERRVRGISDLTTRRNLALRKAVNENDTESYEAIHLECCEEASRVLADALCTAAFLSRDRLVPGDNPCGINLLANSSFEKGDGSSCPAGWVVGWFDTQDRAGRADWVERTTRNTRENHTGTGSVSLTFAPEKGIEWRQRWPEAVTVKPGERYFLSGWIKTHKATGSSYFALECYEGNHTPVSRHKSVSVDGNTAWRRIGLEVTIPDGARKARAVCRSENNAGIVWFDDVELVRLDAGTKIEEGLIGYDTVVLHLNGDGKGYEIPDRSNYHELNGPIITCSGNMPTDLHGREKARHYLGFDGTDDFLELPYSRVEDALNPSGGFFVEMELFVSGAQDAYVLSKEIAGRGYRLALDRSGLATFTVFSPGKGTSVTAPCPVGKWVRLEISAKTGEKTVLCIDGRKVAESAGPVPELNAGEADFYLASNRGVSGFFRGKIAEVKISRFSPGE